jgi:acetyl-CoA C-acetyltransferase
MVQKEIYLAGGVRTAVAGFSGAFTNVTAPVLGAQVVKAALDRAGIQPDQVDEVIFGNVLSAGLGQNVARQVVIGAGLRPETGATTVNKLCGSGLKTVMLAAQAIQCGDANLIVAGGTENMTRAPYLLEKARAGYKMGHGELVDSLLRDGLLDTYNDLHMGMYGDKCAAKYNVTRQEQDDYAVQSYKKALAAMESGISAEEIVPIEVRNGKAPTIVKEDEEPKRFNEEKLRQLRPAFGKEGTVTAGNASSVDDGAAAIVVLSKEKAEELGVKAQAKILGYATASREPEWFTVAPIDAIRKVPEGAGQTQDEDRGHRSLRD